MFLCNRPRNLRACVKRLLARLQWRHFITPQQVPLSLLSHEVLSVPGVIEQWQWLIVMMMMSLLWLFTQPWCCCGWLWWAFGCSGSQNSPWVLATLSFSSIWLLGEEIALLFSSLRRCHIKLKMSGRNHTDFITPPIVLHCDCCQLLTCQHLN